MEDFANDLLGPKQPLPSAPVAPTQRNGINMPAVLDTLRAVPEYAAGGVLGLSKGVADYAVGSVQNIANLPFMPDAAAQGVSNYISARNQAYANAVPNAQNSVQVGRVAGNILPTLAAGQASPSPTLLGRMAQSGKVGAVSSFLSPYEGDPKDFWLSKGLQTGLSGALAFAAPVVLEPVFRGLSSAVNAIASKVKGTAATLTGKASDAAVEGQIRIELQREGVDWSALSGEIRASLTDEAKRAIKNGGKLDPDALTRLAKAKQFGIDLTQGQATRNPLAWSREQNLARTEPGQDIAARYNEQNSKFIGELDNQIGVRGGGASDPYDVGKTVIKSLESADRSLKKPVDQAYTTARDHLGRAAPMDVAEFSRQANLALDEKMLGSSLPPNIRDILNNVSLGKYPLNVNTAVQMDQVMSAAQREVGKGTPAWLAISEVRKALNGAPIADNVGADAKAAFDFARGLAKKRFDVIEKTPALADVVDEGTRLAPEKFVEKYVISNSASVDDVGALLKQLDPSAKMQMQTQILAYLKDKATSSANSEVAKFSQSAFKSALDRVGDRKLALIFGEESAKRLRDLQTISAIAQADPVAAGVNRSWTTPAAVDFFDRLSKIPGIGPLMGKPQDLYRGYLAGSALNFPLGTPQGLGAGILSESFLARLQPRVGMLGAPIGAGVAAGLIQQ